MNNSTSDPPSTPRRVLFVRLSALGDVIHCLPAVEAARQLWPEAHFDFVSETMGAAVLHGHPSLERVLELPRKDWEKRGRRIGEWRSIWHEWRTFRRMLREQTYDVVLDLQGNLRSAWIGWAARSKVTYSHHATEVKDGSGRVPLRRPAEPSGRVHRVQKNLHLLRTLGWEGEAPESRLPDYTAEVNQLRAADDCPESMQQGSPVLLHPFVSAAGRYKEWPIERYARLAQELAKAGHASVVSWAPSDLEPARRLVDLSEGTTELAPATRGVRQLAALIAMSQLVVAGDTGTLHLAAALGIPSVGLYGPKDPRTYGPWQQHRRVLRAEVPCAPCLLRRCDHAICMQTISASSAASAVLDLMDDLALS